MWSNNCFDQESFNWNLGYFFLTFLFCGSHLALETHWYPCFSSVYPLQLAHFVATNFCCIVKTHSFIIPSVAAFLWFKWHHKWSGQSLNVCLHIWLDKLHRVFFYKPFIRVPIVLTHISLWFWGNFLKKGAILNYKTSVHCCNIGSYRPGEQIAATPHIVLCHWYVSLINAVVNSASA